METTFLCLFDLQPYDLIVAPALREYTLRYDPRAVVSLLREVKELLPVLRQDLSRPLLTEEDYEHWMVSIAPDAGYKPSAETIRELSAMVVQPLCVPRDTAFPPMLDLGPAKDWLAARSEWFADLMEGGEELAGGRLEFSFGSNNHVATRQQITQFLEEVKSVENAVGDAARHLLMMLKAADANGHYTLLMTRVGNAS